MKILVFSDSHNSIINMKIAIEKHKRNCDAVVFLGDGLKDIEQIKDLYPQIAFFIVKGNCDMFCSDIPAEKILTLDGVKFLITHGHLHGVKYGYEKITRVAYDCGADVVLFGHTHVPCDEVRELEDKKIRLFNPGSAHGEGRFGVINISNGVVITSHGKIF